jgi:hypothetical protein
MGKCKNNIPEPPHYTTDFLSHLELILIFRNHHLGHLAPMVVIHVVEKKLGIGKETTSCHHHGHM